jgi:uncharacterized protein (TIGR02996 family)
MSWLVHWWRQALRALGGADAQPLPPDGEAFLRSILDDPDDATARLVFADWLDEQGHAGRAEFIRVQCELDELPEDDPHRRGLEARAAVLLGRNVSAWSGAADGLADGVVFRRGFVECVRITPARFAEFGGIIRSRVPLREAEFVAPFEPEEANLGVLAQCVHLAPLRAFRLNALPVREPELGRLLASPNLGRLRMLRCERTVLDEAALNALAASPVLGRLTELGLAGCLPVVMQNAGRGCVGLRMLLGAPVGGLEVLDLSHTHLGPEGIGALAESPNLRGLRTLRLVGCGLGPDGVRAILDSPHLAGLVRLDLRDNELLAGYPSARARRAEVRRDLAQRFGERARLR